MPGELSVYPFVNAFPKTKHLPLLQFVCRHIHVCTLWVITQLSVGKWHPWASPVSYFQAEYICMWACICYLCAGILCVPMCENTPWQ